MDNEQRCDECGQDCECGVVEPIKGDPFFNHRPTEECAALLALIREGFRTLRDEVASLVPHSREKSLALTHLQTAMMFAIQGTVINDEDSEPVI